MSAISATISETETETSDASVTTTPIFSLPLSSLLSSSPKTIASTTTISSPKSSFSLVSIPATAAVGGITITQPNQQQGAAAVTSPLYKIAPGEHITFGWLITSVLASPTSLTISAICDNGNTYAVGPTDGVVPGTATQVVWDIWKYQVENPATPLAQAGYTLSVWGDRGADALPRPGYLAGFGGLQFAMYTPQVYTSIEDGWQCSVCSGAGVNVVHPVFVSLVVTFFLVFFSGFHLLRTSSRTN